MQDLYSTVQDNACI